MSPSALGSLSSYKENELPLSTAWGACPKRCPVHTREGTELGWLLLCVASVVRAVVLDDSARGSSHSADEETET